MLWRIFVSKRDELTGESRRLYYEELSDLYSSPSFFRVIRLEKSDWQDV